VRATYLFLANDSKDIQHVPERKTKDPAFSAPANEELDGANIDLAHCVTVWIALSATPFWW
jgi:hypothetical protein